MDNHQISFMLGDRGVDFQLLPHPTWEGRAIYEPEVVNAMGHFVKPGDCVIDAGANMGFFAVLASRLVGDEGLVLAMEPDPRSFEELKANVLINGCNNVATLDTALWSVDCEQDFWLTEEDGYSSFIKYDVSTGSRKVMARSLDSLLSNPDSPQPQFLKIDCEGSEEEIVTGAKRILEKGVNAVVLEFNFALLDQIKLTPRPIREFMASLGYDMFLINLGDKKTKEFGRPVKVDRDVDFSIVGGIHINVLFSTQDKVDAAWQ